MNKAKRFRKLNQELSMLLHDIIFELQPYRTGETEDYYPVFTDGKNYATMYNENCIDFNGIELACDNAYVEMFLRFNITV